MYDMRGGNIEWGGGYGVKGWIVGEAKAMQYLLDFFVVKSTD